MANTARLTQAIVESMVGEAGVARVTQAIIEVMVGLGIQCANPPNGVVGVPYSHTFTFGGGDPPYVFTITAGSLPTGLSLNAATAAVTGTPTVAGTFPFTVTVTDSLTITASADCSITIAAPAARVGFLSGAGGFRPSACGCTPGEMAAERYRRSLGRRQAWPYPHSFPPPVSDSVQEHNTVAIPAAGSSAVVLAYRVPPGFRFIMQGIMQACSAATLPGDLEWTIDVNTPLSLQNFQAMPLQGLVAIDVPLGSILTGQPWMLPRAYEFAAYDLVQSKALNVNLGAGSLSSWFLGYLTPVMVGGTRAD